MENAAKELIAAHNKVLNLERGYEDAIDHLVPLNLGGSNNITIFQLICKKCNLDKLGHTIKTS